MNQKWVYGITPLIAAAKRTRNPEIIVTLLEFGADPTVRDKKGHTALYYAQKNDRLKNSTVIKRLKRISK